MIPLIVDLETEWRGGQNQALLLLKGLYERGHAAELVAAKGSSLSHRASNAGICVHHVSRDFLRAPAAARIWSLLRDGRIELVHANEAHGVTAAWLAGVQRSVPFVISRRVGYPIGKNPISRARYNSANCILANSQWVAEQATSSGADREKVHVVYEGVAIPKRVTPEQRLVARLRWGVSDDGPLLGCVGVLLPDKGQEFLIRAVSELRKDFPNARLLLAGEGSHRSTLEELARTLNLSDSVIFTGFVKDIERVYEALDLFLFPALFEGLGTSLLAAMGYSIPSIASRRCAFPEIIESEKSGLLVEEPETQPIVAAVKKLLLNPQFARRIGEEGRKQIELKFSVDGMVEHTLARYDQLLGR
jgi:glycosyltransferase involved in cell wall biosynthesis